MSKRTELSFKFEEDDSNEDIKQKINSSLDIINAGGGTIESFRIVVAINENADKKQKVRKDRKRRRKHADEQPAVTMTATTEGSRE